MQISIIVPVYNASKYLERCIKSIVTQNYSNYQLVLIDDGSDDGSGEICDKWAEIEKRIIVIHKKNSGVSSTRNVGLEVCSGDIIGFCDSDDFLEDDALQQISDIFSKEPSVDILFTGFYNTTLENDSYSKILMSDKCGYCSVSKAMEHVLCNPNVMGSVWNKYYRKNVLDGIYFCDELTHCEDAAFNVEILSKNRNCNVYLTDVPTYNYFSNPQSVTANYVKLFDASGVLKYNKSMHYIIDNLDLKESEKIFVNKAIFTLSIGCAYDKNTSAERKALLRNELKKTFKDYLFHNGNACKKTYVKNLIKFCLVFLKIR